MNPTTDVTNPAGARAYTTPDRDFIGRLVLESRTAPSANEAVAKFHQALMSETVPDFISQAALYASRAANNRDIAAALVAFLYARAKTFEGPTRQAWFDAASERLSDSIRDLSMLRSFIAYYRGPAQKVQTRWGYKAGIGGRLQKDLKKWINNHPLDKLIKGKAGTAPTTRDIFRMVHPGSDDPLRNNVYRWITHGKILEGPAHPLIQDLEALKAGETPSEESHVWRLPFDMIGPLIGSNVNAWRILAKRTTLKNLVKSINTYARQLIYADDSSMITFHEEMLRDQPLMRTSGLTGYEVFRAMQSLDESVPAEIKSALDEALHNALANIESTDESILVLVDVSGSMQANLYNHRGRDSKLRRCDAAALVASALQMAGPMVVLVPFDTKIRDIQSLNEAEGIAGKARAIAGFMGGGTDVGYAMEWVASNIDSHLPDKVVLISDMESLPAFDRTPMSMRFNHSSGTRAQQAWDNLRQRKENAQLLLIDVHPDGTQQIQDEEFGVTGLAGWGPETLKLVNQWLHPRPLVEDGPVAPIDIVETILNFRLDNAQVPA